MRLIFRKVDENSESDIVRFCELMDQLSQRAQDAQLLKKRIADMNARDDAVLLVAEDADRGVLCGSLLAVACGDFCGSCAPFMLIENVVTHSDYRRQGVGRRLFEEIERWGRERNVRYGILCSANTRSAAHEFYPAIGYEEIKGFKKYL